MMGELDVNLVEKIAPRPVPSSAAEFAARRRQFRAEVRAALERPRFLQSRFTHFGLPLPAPR